MIPVTQTVTELQAVPKPDIEFVEPKSTFWDDYEEASAAEAEARRQEKIALCGVNCIHVLTPHGRKKIVVHCGQWRDKECPKCFQWRKNGFQVRIQHAIADPEISVYVVPLSDAAVIPVDKENYLKLPAKDGRGVMFYNATGLTKIGQQVLSTQQFSDESWDLWTNTPKNSRIAGNLGKREEEEEDEEQAGEGQEIQEVDVQVYKITTADSKEADTAWDMAVAATDNLPEATVQEVLAKHETRVNVFKDNLKAAGIHILKEKVELQAIKLLIYRDLVGDIDESEIPF